MSQAIVLPAEDALLSRDTFDQYVKWRAHGRCVVCSAPAEDAHHIFDRKLYPNGGYYLGNGAAVCGACHWLVETTTISVEDIRLRAGIRTPVLPPGFLSTVLYDKWGNRFIEHGLREAGQLATDTGMLRALQAGNVRHLLVPWLPAT